MSNNRAVEGYPGIHGWVRGIKDPNSQKLSNYQSAETAWRYDVYIDDAKRSIEDAKKSIERLKAILATAEADLKYLEEHPPLYHLFNWSA